jgi:hypothetical protein
MIRAARGIFNPLEGKRTRQPDAPHELAVRGEIEVRANYLIEIAG